VIIKNAFVPGYEIFILDVCTPAEYNYTHIEGVKLVPLKNVPLHDLVNLSNDDLLRCISKIITICQKQMYKIRSPIYWIGMSPREKI
jgi:rhodanese-related sulfurtransferase